MDYHGSSIYDTICQSLNAFPQKQILSWNLKKKNVLTFRDSRIVGHKYPDYDPCLVAI